MSKEWSKRERKKTNHIRPIDIRRNKLENNL
jgi:hypothetical protein